MQHERYRSLLQQKAQELKQSLKRRGEITVERASDNLDETLLAAERESAVYDLERTYRLLRQVEIALDRLDRGKYGLCVKCGSAITEKRLHAVPWALYCFACQETADRLHDYMNAARGRAA